MGDFADRLAAHGTASHLARRLSVPQSTATRWLAGENEPPGYVQDLVLARLASTGPGAEAARQRQAKSALADALRRVADELDS